MDIIKTLLEIYGISGEFRPKYKYNADDFDGDHVNTVDLSKIPDDAIELRKGADGIYSMSQEG